MIVTVHLFLNIVTIMINRFITKYGMNCCWITLLTRKPWRIKPFYSKACYCNLSTTEEIKQQDKKYRLRRALLYIPGSDEKKIRKIPSLRVDCAVMDCEDGVAYNKKVKERVCMSNVFYCVVSCNTFMTIEIGGSSPHHS